MSLPLARLRPRVRAREGAPDRSPFAGPASGACVKGIIVNPAPSYAFNIGTGGAAAPAGASNASTGAVGQPTSKGADGNDVVIPHFGF